MAKRDKIRYRIEISPEQQTRLAKLMQSSERSVRDYLNYNVNTKKAEKARRIALMRIKDGGCGGVIWRMLEDVDIKEWIARRTDIEGEEI